MTGYFFNMQYINSVIIIIIIIIIIIVLKIIQNGVTSKYYHGLHWFCLSCPFLFVLLLLLLFILFRII